MQRHAGWTRSPVLALLAGAGSVWAAPYTAAQGRATFEHRVLIVNVRGTVEGVTASVQLDPNDLAATQGQVQTCGPA
jgi:polyisoprenoid-binding protein YceI